MLELKIEWEDTPHYVKRQLTLGCSASTNAMQGPIKETDLGNSQKTPDTRSRLRLESLLIKVAEIVLNGIVSRTCSMP